MQTNTFQNVLSAMDNLILKINGNNIPGRDVEVKWLQDYLTSSTKSLLIVGDGNNGQFKILNIIADNNIISDDILLLGTSTIVTTSGRVSEPFLANTNGKIIPVAPKDLNLSNTLINTEISEVFLPYSYDTLTKEGLNVSACTIADIKSAEIKKLYKVICSDLIIFTINAAQALSMSQKELLKAIYEINNTNVIIVVTGLELIREKEKVTVADYIITVLNKSFADLKILFLDSKDENIIKTDIINMKASIMEKLANENLLETRTLKVQNRLLYLIDECVVVLDNKRKSVEETLSNQKNKDDLKKESILATQQGWEELRIEFEKRANHCLEYIFEELDHLKQSISEQLHFELSKSNNPKEWWTKDLPFRLKKEFENNTRGIEKQLQARIIGDYKWLVERARSYYARNVPVSDNINIYNIEKSNPDIIPRAEELKDLKLIRYITMAGSGTASVVMWFIAGPIGAIVSAAGGIIGDRIITREIQNQQERLSFALYQLIDNVINNSKDGISQRVSDGYDRIIQATVVTESQWEKDVSMREKANYKEEQEISSISEEIAGFNSIKTLVKQ